MRYTLRVLIHICSLVAVASCSSESEDLKQRAQDFLRAGMYEEAVQALQVYVEQRPADGEAHLLLAKAHLGALDWSAAQAEFDRATLLDVDLKPRVGEVRFEVGAALLQGSTVESQVAGFRILTSAIESNPSLAEQVARTLRDKGLELAEAESPLAEEYLRKAIELSTDLMKDEDTQFFLAVHTDNNEERKARLQRFLALFPTSAHLPAAWLEIGKTFYSDQDYSAAKNRLSYLVEEYRDSAQAAESQELLFAIEERERELERARVEEAKKADRAEQRRLEKQTRADLMQSQREAAAAETQRKADALRLEQKRQEEARQEALKLERENVRSEIVSGKTLSGTLRVGLNKYEIRLRFTEYEPSSGRVVGILEYPGLNGSVKVEGTLHPESLELKFETVGYVIENRDVQLGCVYDLAPRPEHLREMRGRVRGRIGSACARSNELSSSVSLEVR